MANITATQAKATTIFYLTADNEIESDNLFDFVMESEEMTTSPRGVEGKVFVQENEESQTWDLREWQPNGHSRAIETFDTEEEANDEHFDRIYKYDFLPDDQRDIQYFITMQEAEEALADRLNDE